MAQWIFLIPVSLSIQSTECILAFQYDTKYFYKIGDGESAREFWFQTPPEIGPNAAYKFGIIGQ